MTNTTFLTARWSADTSMRPHTDLFETKQLLAHCYAGHVSTASNSWYHAHRRGAIAKAIAELGALPEDWDGEGACKIAREAISLAQDIIGILPDSIPLPEFAPNPNGTLSLYWSLASGSAELEIGKTRHSWAIVGGDGRVRTVCSGENRAFNSSLASMDLLAALAPQQPSFGTDPLTRISMKREWGDFVSVL